MTPLAPGWYVQLLGEPVDLDDWIYTLNEPFDPTAFMHHDGTYLLSSQEFTAATEAADVREKALALIARLNGAMAVMHAAGPLRSGGIYRIAEDGSQHVSVFAEGTAISVGRVVARATATVLGPDGQPLPPPPPQRSVAQLWNDLAAQNDDIADLLEQHGKADGWYEIYKTIELAEEVVGSKHRLAKLLGDTGAAFLNLRHTANFYRHARASKPEVPTRLEDAKPLLHYIVRTVLEVAAEREACSPESIAARHGSTG